MCCALCLATLLAACPAHLDLVLRQPGVLVQQEAHILPDRQRVKQRAALRAADNEKQLSTAGQQQAEQGIGYEKCQQTSAAWCPQQPTWNTSPTFSLSDVSSSLISPRRGSPIISTSPCAQAGRRAGR